MDRNRLLQNLPKKRHLPGGLQVCGEKELLDEMVAAFNQIAGISAKMMDLN